MNRVERGIGYLKKFIIKKGHVVSIAVLEEFRGQGIGRTLMLLGMEAMRKHYGAKEVYLEVRVTNTPAIRLYEKLGFVKVKRITGYYSDGEDAFVMAKEL